MLNLPSWPVDKTVQGTACKSSLVYNTWVSQSENKRKILCGQSSSQTDVTEHFLVKFSIEQYNATSITSFSEKTKPSGPVPYDIFQARTSNSHHHLPQSVTPLVTASAFTDLHIGA